MATAAGLSSARPLILDTDIGGDPDDTFALLLALGSPEVDVRLIITSDEHHGHRATFAHLLLGALGREVHVVSGADKGQDRCCVVDDIVRHGKPSGDVLAAVRSVVGTGEAWYACIGPQSNLARIIAEDPSLAQRLHIVIMGGSFEERIEHNIRYDLDAAKAVFRASIDKRYVTSESTYAEALKLSQESPIYKGLHWRSGEDEAWKSLVRESIDAFYRKLYPVSYFHDPLALSDIIQSGFLTFHEEPLRMTEEGRFVRDPTGTPTYVSIAADYAAFLSFFRERIGL